MLLDFYYKNETILGDGGKDSYYLIGTKFVWDDEKILERDSGDGCTAL